MKLKLESINCPLCRSSENKYLYKKPDARFFISPIEFKVLKCENCTVGFVSPRPTIEEIKYFYPDEYYNYESRSINNPNNRKRFPIQASYFKDLHPGSKILDVGCANGSFSKYLSKNLGLDAYGMDLNKPEILDHDPTKLKFGIISDFDYQNEFFDAVSAWAVINHSHEPMLYFSNVYRLLKSGGRFVFLVTNFNSLFSRYAYAEDIPRQMIFFTKKSLEFCALQTGFTIQNIKCTNDIYGGQGYPVFRSQFLRNICGSDWKQIAGRRRFPPGKPLSPILKIISKGLTGLGHLMIPPPIEAFLGISGMMVVIMVKKK